MVKLNKPNIKINKSVIIKALVTVGVALLLVVLTLAVANDWQEKQNIKTQEQARIADAQQAKEAEYNRAVSSYKLYVDAYDKERVNCEKGASIYANTLTPAQKLAVQRLKGVPTCGPAVPKP